MFKSYKLSKAAKGSGLYPAADRRSPCGETTSGYVRASAVDGTVTALVPKSWRGVRRSHNDRLRNNGPG
jgi:hypothetical protein